MRLPHAHDSLVGFPQTVPSPILYSHLPVAVMASVLNRVHCFLGVYYLTGLWITYDAGYVDRGLAYFYDAEFHGWSVGPRPW